MSNHFSVRLVDITYFRESQLPGESRPMEDRHFHPAEPRTLRMTVETHF